jgi:hypothetical protein
MTHSVPGKLVTNAPVPWDLAARVSLVNEPNCWNTCGGGFCCSNGHPDFEFQLLPMHGTTIIYIGDEYDYLKQHGRVHEHLDPGQTVHRLNFDFGGPKELSLVHTTCRFLGHCGPHVDKPLLCKIYPFLPILDIAGELEDVYPASIFEVTFLARGIHTPCSIWTSRKDKYVREFRENPALLEPLRYPLIIFYLRAAKLFVDNYIKCLRADERLKDLSGRDFWRSWEIRYLGGRLVDRDEMRGSLFAVYKEMEREFGQFL